MKPQKAMTLRLSAEQAEQLELVAAVDDVPVAEVVRDAIDRHIGERQKDAVFRSSLKDRIERAQRLLGP
jgi:predicted DNA-binding protein